MELVNRKVPVVLSSLLRKGSEKIEYPDKFFNLGKVTLLFMRADNY